MDQLRVREQRRKRTLQQVGVTPVTSLIACIYNTSVSKADGFSFESDERLLKFFSGVPREWAGKN
jgi:hypothetical protein